MEPAEIKYNLGNILKEERLKKRITLEEVNQRTKIPLKFLKAIEEGESLNINPVYLKGLLKIYCNFLGLDYRNFSEQILKIPHETKKESPLFADNTGMKLKVWQPHYLNIVMILVGAIFILGLVIFGFRVVNRRQITALKETKQSTTKTVVSTPQGIDWSNQQIKPVELAKTIKVRIRAKQDCWIKAVVDGKVVFQSILKKGRFEVWEANDKIELSLGNAGGVELYVNERPFSTLGRSGQMIRRLVIDQKGLQVLR